MIVSIGNEAAGRDEFGTLQQHIDELTDQKFELARGLERQQQVAERLAAENQRLLDDYNHQVSPRFMQYGYVIAIAAFWHGPVICRAIFYEMRQIARCIAHTHMPHAIVCWIVADDASGSRT